MPRGARSVFLAPDRATFVGPGPGSVCPAHAGPARTGSDSLDSWSDPCPEGVCVFYNWSFGKDNALVDEHAATRRHQPENWPKPGECRDNAAGVGGCIPKLPCAEKSPSHPRARFDHTARKPWASSPSRPIALREGATRCVDSRHDATSQCPANNHKARTTTTQPPPQPNPTQPNPTQPIPPQPNPTQPNPFLHQRSAAHLQATQGLMSSQSFRVTARTSRNVDA